MLALGASRPGLRTCYVDDSLAPAAFPTELLDLTHWNISAVAPRDGVIRSKIIIPDGCNINGLPNFNGLVEVEYQGSTPCVAASNFASPGGKGRFMAIGLRGDSSNPVMRCTGTGSFYDIGANPVTVIVGPALLQIPAVATANLFEMGVGGALTLNLYAFALTGARLVKGPVGSTWNLRQITDSALWSEDQPDFLGTFSLGMPGRDRRTIRPSTLPNVEPVPSTVPITAPAMGDVCLLDPTAGDINQTMPNIVTGNSSQGTSLSSRGVDFTIVNVAGVNNVIATPVGGQTIVGSATVLPGASGRFLASSVSKWYRL
jgi:hypothetical protein